MCDEGASKRPYNASRAARLQMLAQQYQLDAIILITGFDGSYNLESKVLTLLRQPCRTDPPNCFGSLC